MRKTVLLFTLSLIAALPVSLLAQIPTFQKTYGGTGREIGNDLIEVSDGYLIAGSTSSFGAGNNDALLLKVGFDGGVIWQKTYGGPKDESFSSLTAANGDGYVAAGVTVPDGQTQNDIYVVRVNNLGNVLWSRTFGGNASDDANRVLRAPGRGYVVSGGQRSLNPTGTYDGFITLLNEDGNVVWSRSYPGLIGTIFNAESLSGDTLFVGGGGDASAVYYRVDINTGNVIAGRNYDGSGTEALYYMRQTLDGNILMSDHTWSATGGAEMRQWVQKTEKSGAVLWSKVYGKPGTNLRGRAEVVSDGGYLLTPFDNLAMVASDAVLAKIDGNGNIEWSRSFGGPRTDRLLKAQETSDGGFIAVGHTRSLGMGNDDVFLVKTNAEGLVMGCCNRDYGLIAENFNPQSNPFLFPPYAFFDPADAAITMQLSQMVTTDYCASPAPVYHDTITFCLGDSVVLNGEVFDTSAIVMFTLPSDSLGSCDTLLIYNLIRLDRPTRSETVSFCPGGSVTIGGQVYTQAGTVVDTVAATTGASCDTIVTYTLTLLPQPTSSRSVSFCAGGSVTIGGQVYTQAGTVVDTVAASGGGCDTIVTYTLTVLPMLTSSQSVSFCAGSSVTIGGQTYTQAGTVIDTVSANGGCDSIITYTLTVLAQPTSNQTLSFCPGSSVTIGGNNYTQPGTVVDTLTGAGANGCDSVITYTLQFLPFATGSETISFCPGSSVTINGNTYSQPGTVVDTLAGGANGCDSIVTYTLQFLPLATGSATISFCPGSSVTIGGQTYTQPGTVTNTLAGAGANGCDSTVTYTLQFLPVASSSQTLSFCPGTSVNIDGQTYTQPGTVIDTLAGAGANGCDSIITYTLQFLPQPTTTQVIEFCPGASVTIGGQTITQPGTVVVTLPSTTGGCDTLATYNLQFYTLPQPSNVALACPANIVTQTAPGVGTAVATFATPSASTDCPCGSAPVGLLSGLASGSNFPVGTNTVCFRATDDCGTSRSCCFTVTVQGVEAPCDTKDISCIRYELLNVTKDAAQNRTYRIRVTNNCAPRLVYFAVQTPDGVQAMSPANNSSYTAPSGNTYDVRNPNYTPFYSIRFKSDSDSIGGGQSETFRYTLPAQADPTFIHVIVKLENGTFYEAHLNTFGCPFGTTPSQKPDQANTRNDQPEEAPSLILFPNPTSGELFADLSAWSGKDNKTVHLRVMDAQGRQLMEETAAVESAWRINLPAGLSNGLYFLEVASEEGGRQVMRFVFER